MEKWYSIVGNMKDESVSPYNTQQFTHRVYRDLSRSKLKEKQKFKNRMGPEFEQWSAKLVDEFGQGIVTEILNDDDFWVETLLITQGI